jgi:hypothetical protein
MNRFTVFNVIGVTLLALLALSLVSCDGSPHTDASAASEPTATPTPQSFDEGMNEMMKSYEEANAAEKKRYWKRWKEPRSATPTPTPQSVEDLQQQWKKEDEEWRKDQSISAGITMHNYLLLREGISYFSVVSILGKEGKEVSSSGNLKVYAWSSWGGLKTITVSFYNNKLAAKAQTGL